MSIREEAIDYFIDIASQYEDYYDIKSRVDSLCECGVITQEDYNYILQNWDNLLKKYGVE